MSPGPASESASAASENGRRLTVTARTKPGTGGWLLNRSITAARSAGQIFVTNASRRAWLVSKSVHTKRTAANSATMPNTVTALVGVNQPVPGTAGLGRINREPGGPGTGIGATWLNRQRCRATAATPTNSGIAAGSQSRGRWGGKLQPYASKCGSTARWAKHEWSEHAAHAANLQRRPAADHFASPQKIMAVSAIAT